ncbi:hypothetical protein [Roseivirga pacifica]
MSHIDSYDHEYIGHLGYLPIYHPLQEIEKVKWGDYDFGADPTNLVLGGGSGEHPGLVLHKLECFAAKFLLEAITEKQEASLSDEDREYLADLALPNYTEVFEFCEWRVDEFSSLHEMAKTGVTGEPLKEDQRVEEWLLLSIGELIHYSLPELNPEKERLDQIFGQFDFYPFMENVSIPPPGYPKLRGRLVKEGETVWGVHRFN